MKTSKLSIHSSDIIFSYRNGESASNIARRYNTTTTTVTSLLKNLGIMPSLKRGEKDQSIKFDENIVIELYKSGENVSDILQRFSNKKRSKSWVYECLKRASIEPRGHNGDYFRTEESIINQSKGREYGGAMTQAEKTFFYLMSEFGIKSTPQKSFGMQNMDFFIATHSVAVEVYCRGTFRLNLRNGGIIKRIKEFSDRGWHTYIFVSKDHKTIGADGINDMLIWLDFIKRQPAHRRQYRMVRGTCELLACGCSDSNDFSDIFSLKDTL